MASSKHKSDLPKNAALGKKFAIVAARYNETIVQELVNGALKTLEALGAKETDIQTVWVPGAFEIPLTAQTIAQHQRVDAILCLGVVIKGETRHDEYIAKEVAQGISQAGRIAGLPIVFGVLTTETLEQAKARAGGAQGHKGIEAAETAVSMIHVLEQIKGTTKRPGGSVGFGVV